MTRRDILKFAGSAPAILAAAPPQSAAVQPSSRMGVASSALSNRTRLKSGGPAGPAASNPLEDLEYCRQIGAGGLQSGFGQLDGNGIRQLRRKTEEYGMYFEAALSMPRGETDLRRFQEDVQKARSAGATVIRSVMLSGRRYETFTSAEAFQNFKTQSWLSLTAAEPVLRKSRIRLALENHKDWRIDEMTGMLKRISSEFIGACVDVGNNVALLEDPVELAQALAPYAYSAHLKDMGVKQYEDGFLLSEVVFGEGFLDLKKIVQILRQAQPNLRFSLEMITRDPLQIPCLTEGYWATFDNLPGRDLARTLTTVRTKQRSEPLPTVSQLSLEERVKVEEENNVKCLLYARDQLGI